MTERRPFAIRVEPDHAKSRKVVTIAIVAAVVFGGSIAWVATLMPARRPAVSAIERDAPAQVGGVDQTLFDAPLPAEAARRTDRARLESYGWVDRDAGIVHIPIDRAIDLMVEERR